MTARSALTTARPEELLAKGTEELGLALEPSTRQQFLYYADELLKWNTRINLTGLKTAQEVVVKHFLDSLAVWPWVKDLDSLADIGTGAGFPGLPLKLVLPHLHLTLIEPTAKKTAFLHFVIAHLGLSDVEVRQVHLTAPEAQQLGAVISRSDYPGHLFPGSLSANWRPPGQTGGTSAGHERPPPGGSPMAGSGGPGGPIPSPAPGKMGIQPASNRRTAAPGDLGEAEFISQ